MKIIPIAAVVAFSAALQIVYVAGNLETQLDTVNEKIGVVEKVISQLRERQYVSHIAKAIDTLALVRVTLPNIMEPYCERPLENIEDATNASKAAGKNPADCYATAISEHKALEVSTANQVAECFKIMYTWLNATADAVQSRVQEGMQIHWNLNMIFPTCYATDTDDIESCIAGILPNATTIVDTYNTTASHFINNVPSNETADAQITTCFGKAGDISEAGCPDIETKFNACVAVL